LAALWLIPRLAGFTSQHPDVDVRISADTRVVDLERGRFDAAVRYLQDRNAPATALRLFGDTTLPVLSPALLKKSARPLRKPADLAHYVLLAYEDEGQRRPWLSWPAWLEMAGVADLRPAGSVAFNQYEPTLRAAVDGQAWRWPRWRWWADLLAAGKLVRHLPQRFANPRSYYLVLADRAAANPAVEPFRHWLASQAEIAAGGTKL
jgi:LysR family glycine cleavage system transcriptional activator